MDQLAETDRGRFRVFTEHSSYDVNLTDDGMTLVRNSGDPVVGRSVLREDTAPIEVNSVVRCEVGSSAVFYVVIAASDPNYGFTRRETTLVRSIERLDD